MIIGQDELVNKLDSLIAENKLPNTIAFIGEEGSGKHTLTQYLASKLNIELFNITDKLNNDDLSILYTLTNPVLCYIELSKLSIKQQNIILKTLEEPPSKVYFILLIDNVLTTLDTILNRCFKLYLAKYSKDTLSKFCDSNKKEFILQLASTIGQVKQLNENENIKKFSEYLEKIVKQLHNASYQNTLTLCNTIVNTFKISLKLFVRGLEVAYSKSFQETGNKQDYKNYLIVSNEAKKLQMSSNLDETMFIYHLLSVLWKENR